MTYGGHRVHPRRRMATSQAHRAPERADVDDQDHLDDLWLTDPHGSVAPPVVVTSLDGSHPAAQPHPAEPAPTAGARTFVEALALALCDAAPEALTPDQLDHLRAVLAVVAPALVLTTDPDPLEPTVPTSAPHVVPVDEHARPEPEDGQRTSPNLGEVSATGPEPEVDDGQGSELAALLAELVAERAETAVVLAERDRLLAEAGDPERIAAAEVAAIAAARQHAQDEHAIADLRARVDAAQHLTAVATAHLIVSVAGVALASHGLPSTEYDALALTTTVPTDALIVAVDGRVDIEAARTVLTAAARSAAGGTR